MKITDPTCILIVFAACSFSGILCFILGSVFRGRRARKEQLQLWAEAERLYRARTCIDLRD